MKNIAAIVTEYRLNSHADVIVGKVLEGFYQDGKEFPRMQIVSMYVDQTDEKRDLSRALAAKHKFTIYPRIEDAITLQKNDVAVDGVLIIGEHGTYPRNERGQIEYPRRRFFEGVTNVLARYKKSIPIFSDKHLSFNWTDAKWMYDRSRELKIPFMAGSSVPVTWRRPPLHLEAGVDLIEGFQFGYGPFEGYGYHAIEGLQCMAERRRGGETGVRGVQCIMGKEMWDAFDRGAFSKDVMEAAIKLVPAHSKLDIREATSNAKIGRDAGLMVIDYRDGFKGVVLMANGWIGEAEGGSFIFAGKIKGRAEPVATQFHLQHVRPFGHFGHLLRAIDSMMQTGHPAYPVERTLLTTGLIDAVMISKAEKGRRVETPYLADIRYTPTNWRNGADAIPPPTKN